MFEHPHALSHYLVWTHRYSHFNQIDVPLCPRTFIKPGPAIFHKVLILQTMQGFNDRIKAYFMCTMGVCQITCSINLMRLNLLNQIRYNLIVIFSEWLFLHGTSLIERHVEKV